MTPPTEPDGDRRLTAKPTLTAEWRVRIEALSGGTWDVYVEDEDAAYELGQKISPRRWRIERRMVTPWQVSSPTMRTLVTVEVLDKRDDTDDGMTVEPISHGNADGQAG